jgi:uncharacterized damage-inducible protein DinB
MSPSESEVELSQSEQLLSVAVTVLQQALNLVDNLLTSDEQLTVPSSSIPGSTIGKHLRHARDHFLILTDCMTLPEPRTLCYDVRSRNRPMESSLQEAHAALLEAINRLEEVVPQQSVDQPLTLTAITPFSNTLQTTFGRELWFASLHCIHHWSMVRVIAHELNVTLPADFGFAPSTLVYQNREGALGCKAKI